MSVRIASNVGNVSDSPSPDRRFCRIPGIVRTEKGTLLVYYESRRGDCSDFALIDLEVLRSTDGGRTFFNTYTVKGDEEAAAAVPKGGTTNNPVMIVDGERIHFLFCRQYKHLFYTYSDDDGKTFAPEREITKAVYETGILYPDFAVGPGHGLALGGRIIVPLWISGQEYDPMWHWPSALFCLYSDDGGESFHMSEAVGGGILYDPNESTLATLPDGRLMISIRHRDGIRERALAFSEDRGTTFTRPYFEPSLPDPGCMGSMTSDREFVYHINCASKEARVDLTVKRSRDAFKTYEAYPVIDPNAGYSDIAVGDGRAFVVYEKVLYDESGGVFFESFPL